MYVYIYRLLKAIDSITTLPGGILFFDDIDMPGYLGNRNLSTVSETYFERSCVGFTPVMCLPCGFKPWLYRSLVILSHDYME
jgi:hypothetical protein